MEKIYGLQNKGRYIYGVSTGDKEIRLGAIGIDGSEVFTIPYRDISAIVHSCSNEPYSSTDSETVTSWARTHQIVLDTAAEQLGVIIPLCFDTILEPKNIATSPDQAVRDWLKLDYMRLHEVMVKIEGKSEYAVQVSYIPGVISRQISERSEEVREIKEELAARSPGMAYIYRQKLEKMVKSETERLGNECFKDFYNRIKKHTHDIVFEKTRKMDNGHVMLLNLSCLVAKERVDSLGLELEEINNIEGFSVHFSGPWPPYSFVTRPVVTVQG